MKSIKIIGIGSPFGDDQIGWQIVESLSRDYATSSHFQSSLQHARESDIQIIFERLDRPGINLLNHLRGADIVYLIDAVKSGSPIGTIHRLENEEIERAKDMFLSTHGFGIAEALKLGRALNELPKKIIFYGIEIGDDKD